MAKQVWREASRELQNLYAQRDDTMDCIRLIDRPPEAWATQASSKAEGTMKLLEKVVELTENALLQQEVLRHASRTLSWQICSPETMAWTICHAWPAFPDLLETLKAIAAMPEA